MPRTAETLTTTTKEANSRFLTDCYLEEAAFRPHRRRGSPRLGRRPKPLNKGCALPLTTEFLRTNQGVTNKPHFNWIGFANATGPRRSFRGPSSRPFDAPSIGLAAQEGRDVELIVIHRVVHRSLASMLIEPLRRRPFGVFRHRLLRAIL